MQQVPSPAFLPSCVCLIWGDILTWIDLAWHSDMNYVCSKKLHKQYGRMSLKCPYRKRVFEVLYPNKKKLIFNVLLPKNHLSISSFGHAQWSWLRNERWWQMASFQEHLKASCSYFTCLMTALLHQLLFVFFQILSLTKSLTTTETTCTGRIWRFLTRCHNTFRNPGSFSTVNWIGHYWSTNFTLLCRHLSVNFNSHTVTYHKLFVIYRQKAVLYYLKRPESLSLLVWNHGTPCFGDSGPSLHEWRNRNNPAL